MNNDSNFLEETFDNGHRVLEGDEAKKFGKDYSELVKNSKNDEDSSK